MRNHYLILILALFPLSLAAKDQLIKVATFDSGFGGYFTAKEIEKEARKLSEIYTARFQITHYGDTANLPYGEKSSDQITNFASKGISYAFNEGAQEVFIACNTASTQFDAIKKVLEKSNPGRGSKTFSIIQSSVGELKRLIDRAFLQKKVVRVAILATPFTVKNMAYVTALAQAYGLPEPRPQIKSETLKRWYTAKGTKIENTSSFNRLIMPDGKIIEVHQLGPGNWVDMIEHAADKSTQEKAVASDLNLLKPQSPFDVVGEFCTHFPVFDHMIKSTALKNGIITKETAFIQQGPLMAGIFKDIMLERLQGNRRKVALDKLQKGQMIESTRPTIYLSGQNLEETRELSRTVFSEDPVPAVEHRNFK